MSPLVTPRLNYRASNILNLLISHPCRALSSRKARARSPMDTAQEMYSSDHDFFNYTSGRFLWNEEARLRERHHVFNVSELCRLVAKASGRPQSDVTAFEKLAEGGWNRIFKATLRSGCEVIARLPFPRSLPKRYSTLSEVATMTFLRDHGLPVPKIHDWSATVENSVGSEYIIMEKVHGTDLRNTWHSMTVSQRLKAVGKIVQLEKALFDISLPACGSIYLKDTLPAGTRTVDIQSDMSNKVSSKFCIGPSAEFLWWHSRRAELGAKIGPWYDSAEVLEAVGERELLWLEKFGRPRYPQESIYRTVYKYEKVKPERQIQSLQDYLKSASFLVPDNQEMNRPTIRHPDLAPGNILFSDSGEIAGVIDWQHCAVLPLFLQAGIPGHFQNYGDEESEKFRPPKLPHNFDSLSDEDKATQEEMYRRRQLHFFYLAATIDMNPHHYHALRFDPYTYRNRLYRTVDQPWEGDNTSLRAQLSEVIPHWSEICCKEAPGCPIRYSEEEIKECLTHHDKQKEIDRCMEGLRDFVGVNAEGEVETERFGEAKEKAASIKAQWMADSETEFERNDVEENFPLQDHEEID